MINIVLSRGDVRPGEVIRCLLPNGEIHVLCFILAIEYVRGQFSLYYIFLLTDGFYSDWAEVRALLTLL